MVNYPPNNLVHEKIVAIPRDYYFRKARNYGALDNALEVVFVDLF